MPRGVYKRRAMAAASAVAVAKQAAAEVVKPALPVESDSTAAPATRAPRGIRFDSRDVDRLAGEDLKTYARQVGVANRDVDGLSEDRLRQNVRVVIANTYELLTE